MYERVGYDERPMSFAVNGTIAAGSEACEVYWDLEQVQNETVLKLFSNGNITRELRNHRDGIWRGQWLHHERMPVQLRPLRKAAIGADI